ncbi:MAG: hypothetical protein IPO28_01865 [Holophagaceae bacterium]|nr:hypothetical protein [Holophagaceae bacterium]
MGYHDARHASLRWLTGTDIGFAIGPSQVDPQRRDPRRGRYRRSLGPRHPHRTARETLPPGPRRPSPSGTTQTSAVTRRKPTRMGFA